MLNWTIGRAYLPSMRSLRSDRTIFRTTLSKRLISRSHPVCFFTLQRVQVGTASRAQPLAAHARAQARHEQRSHARAGTSGAAGRAMPRSSSVWLQAVPRHLPTGHGSFSLRCWVETALPQQCGHGPSPPKRCPYPFRTSSICGNDGS